MNFYENYPIMRPYVGACFRTAGAPSLLLIGESHYLPKGKPEYSDSVWYASSETMLSVCEKDHVNTKELLNKACTEDFPRKGHSIWKESFEAINKYGPHFPKPSNVGDHIAFYNFFLRPALFGKSLKATVADKRYANEAFDKHVEDLKPSGVIFLSVLAYRSFGPRPCSVPSIVTPHPGCAWWNRPARKYGNKKGREILEDFVKTSTRWPCRLDT